jgi:hypothetical protein
MAGMVFTADGRDWGSSSGIFYWVIDTLVEQVHDPDLAAQLREISEYNLGSLSLATLTEAQQHDLSSAIRALPDVARRELPQSSGREAVITHISELAALFS